MSGKVNFALVDQAMNTMDKMKQYVTAGMETALDVVTDFENYPQECDQNTVGELQDIMCEFVHMELELKQVEEAVVQVKTQVQNSTERMDMLPQLKDSLKQLQQRDDQIDVKDHFKFRELQEKIKATVPQDETSESAPLEDVAISQAQASTKCPVSGTEMREPVKNGQCGHRYDKEAIRQLMKQRRGRARCPVAGCPNTKPLTSDDLVDDKELKRLIDKKNRSEKRSR